MDRSKNDPVPVSISGRWVRVIRDANGNPEFLEFWWHLEMIRREPITATANWLRYGSIPEPSVIPDESGRPA